MSAPPVGSPLQASSVINGIVDSVFGAVPIVVQIAVLIVVGVVVAKVLENVAYDLSVRLDVDEKLDATPVSSALGSAHDAGANAVGSLVKYVVVVVALVAAIGVVDGGRLAALNQQVLGYAPHVLAALAVLVVGLVVGHGLRTLVTAALDDRRLTERLDGTVLEGVVGDGAQGPPALARAGGILAEYYAYLVGVLVAVDLLAIPTLDGLLRQAVLYAPQFVGGVTALVAGVVLAEVLGRLVANSATAARTPAPDVLGEVTKGVVVLVAGLVTLDFLGVSTALLETVLLVVVLPVGLAVAIAAGLAFGYGGRDYVAENIDGWSRDRSIEAESTTD